MSEQQREHFRINYPKSFMATLEVRSKKFPILNISQHGIKIVISDGQTDLEAGEIYKGTLVMRCGHRVVVEGKVLRTMNGTAVIYLDEALPLKSMYDEHRLIIQKFAQDQESED